MRKYMYVGDYEERYRKTTLIPGIVELPDAPPRLQNWLIEVTEAVQTKPVVEEPKVVKKATKKKKKLWNFVASQKTP